MNPTDIITVRGLRKSFANVQTLRGVDFTVKQGSIFALLGANGAGKTTIIRILATLLKPDGGSAQVGGVDVARRPERVRELISLAGQFSAVDGVLTGRENLRLIGKLQHLTDIEQSAEELLARFDLLDAADRPVSTWSGGMRRKLDLSMSLLGAPSVIFLDEPTTGLDPQSRAAMWNTIRALNDAGSTVFLTTQYLEEADQLADQIAILHQGRIIVQGAAQELKRLLPDGYVDLRFHDRESLASAASLLREYRLNLNPEVSTATVATDGSARQFAELINRVENAGIPIAAYAQKSPSLEDAFLAIVNDKEAR